MRIPLVGKCIILAFVILAIPLTEIGLVSIILWKYPVDRAYHTLSYVIPVGIALSIVNGLLFAVLFGKVEARKIRRIQTGIDHLKSKTNFAEKPVSLFIRDELLDLEESVAQL